MSVNVNASSEQVVKAADRFTGITNMVVLNINPTMEELKALGSNPNKEPEYITEELKDGITVVKNRLNIGLFHLQGKFKAPLTFWLENRARWNKDRNKVEWINKFGVTAWGKSETEPPTEKWFKEDMARPALVGEGKLSQFIASWANSARDQQAVLDNPMALATGDLTEIKALHAAIHNNEVRVLLGMKKTTDVKGNTNWWPTVYDGYFDRPYNTTYDGFQKALANEYGAFKADYQGSLQLKKWEGAANVAQDQASNLDAPSPNNAPGTGAGGGYSF